MTPRNITSPTSPRNITSSRNLVLTHTLKACSSTVTRYAIIHGCTICDHCETVLIATRRQRTFLSRSWHGGNRLLKGIGLVKFGLNCLFVKPEIRSGRKNAPGIGG